MISYEDFHRPGFTSVPLSKDETVLAASKNYSIIRDPLLKYDVYNKQYTAVSLDRFASFSQTWYDTIDKQASIAYQGVAMTDVLSVMSQMHLAVIALCWLAEKFVESLELQVLPLSSKQNSRTCYFS